MTNRRWISRVTRSFSMPRSIFPLALGAVVLALSACAPAQKPADSATQATARNESEGRRDRETILANVWGVSAKVFATLKEKSGENLSGVARSVASHSMTMVANMVRASASTPPIHPAAFYATVKDFETALNLNWAGLVNGRWRGASTTTNCTSGTCFGLFQVDVNIEPDWHSGTFCKTRESGGQLGLTALLGGFDFCAAQFWWTTAAGGAKCAALNPRGSNPCTTSNLSWTEDFVNRGRAAYVQAVQPGWPENQWYVMYQYYKNIVIDQERARGTSGDRMALLRASTNRWLREAGLNELIRGEEIAGQPDSPGEVSEPQPSASGDPFAQPSSL